MSFFISAFLSLCQSDLQVLCLHVIQMLLFNKFLESVSDSFAINPNWCDFIRMQSWGDVVEGSPKL